MPDAKKNAEATNGQGWICLRERETVRSQIVAAAQDILSRNGLQAVTLGAVARETKIPRATVFSLFTNRKDLIAALTPPLQETTVEAPQEQMSQVEPEAAVEPVTPDEPEAPVVPSPESEGLQPQEASEADANENVSAYDALMRQQADALAALTKQVIVPNPRQARDAVLSRLDARLVVTEQTVAALEQRMGERLKSLETDTGSLSETLKTLRTRLTAFEERQVAALAELRLDFHKASKSGAIAALEIPSGKVEPLPSEDAEASPASATIFEKHAEPQTEEGDIPKMPTYLASARLAAIQAAAATTAPPPPRPHHRSPLQHFLRKNRWLLVGAAGVLVVWFDVYVFAHYQPALGEPQPVARVLDRRAAAVRASWGPRAQLVRGLKYLNGTGVAVNVEVARHWLEQSARAGNPVAQNLMGVLCQTGTGTQADIHAAIAWYEEAAAQGNLKAMTNLGKLYAGGWKDGTDYVKAADWFSKAAAYGDVDAQFDLAILYELGQGVSRNPAEAYKWYMIAGKTGDQKAQQRASILAAQINPDALSSADTAIAGFKPKSANRAANDVPQLSG